jgi:hypothetical protein
MKIGDAFPSKYMKADDVHEELTVTIQQVLMEEMENREGETETKPVIFFKGAKKGMVLNKTNFASIAFQCGDDTDAWAGKEITLYAPLVSAFGETKPALRVK